MATLTFHTTQFEASAPYDVTLIEHTAASGLGFFGGSFGISVPVGQYQDGTYVVNANGTASGVKCSNTKYNGDVPTANSGVSWNGSDVGTSGLPNRASPLNIRFEHDDPLGIRVQNCRLRIFDRNNIDQHASGVTTEVYEVRHPHPTEGFDAGVTNAKGGLKHRGVTDAHGWVTFTEGISMADMVFTAGPGPSGLNTSVDEVIPSADAAGTINWIAKSGDACRATRHDWYVALSASPDAIGSKTDYGLYFTLEYL